MNDKYYIPTCNDFFYGLEYQYQPLGKEWANHTFNEDRPSNVLHNVKTFPYLFRVKYLDEGDFLSLKWEPETTDSGNFFLNDRYRIGYNFFSSKLTLQEKDYIRDGSGNFNWHIIVYKMVIRNKSELRKLLQLLNITD